MTKRERCPIGSLGLHTMNHERTECIWCGPGKLAWKPGRWITNDNGTTAWSAYLPPTDEAEDSHLDDVGD